MNWIIEFFSSRISDGIIYYWLFLLLALGFFLVASNSLDRKRIYIKDCMEIIEIVDSYNYCELKYYLQE